jgi:mannose-6-phosphate isomerase-like protein (cupin superfamily)
MSEQLSTGMSARKVKLASVMALAMWLLASAGLAQAQTDNQKNSGDDSAARQTLPVVYLPKQALDANFAKATPVHQSPVLYDGDHGLRNYTIATSRRYKPSNVEMHMKDTDIMYVLKGSATIVTGVKLSGITPNKLPNGNPGPADEIRATDIVGGDARNLSAGDVIIIPNGVGHQFTKVDGPFMYVVVKCR